MIIYMILILFNTIQIQKRKHEMISPTLERDVACKYRLVHNDMSRKPKWFLSLKANLGI